MSRVRDLHHALEPGDRVPGRLRPITRGTGWKFGFLLKQRGVSVEPRTNEGKLAHEDQGETGTLYSVPEVCAELYFARLDSTLTLSQLELETVAQLAADVYFEEVRGAEKQIRRAFEVTATSYPPAATVVLLKQRLAAVGHKGHPGQKLSTIYYLTQDEAKEFNFPW